MSRAQVLAALAAEPLDCLIIGGGINGAGIARDLALRAKLTKRPLRVGLIEKHHFSSGTSGRNSQLIHGGLRYLKYFEFRLVREALHERSTLLRIAPHLVEPLPFLIPMYSYFARVFYGTGLWIYDALAGEKNISKHRGLSLPEVGQLEPQLNQHDLVGGSVFYDARVHAARFTLENLLEARDNGALLANYVESVHVERGHEGWVVDAKDRLTGQSFRLTARQLIDTTGPWAGETFPDENKLRLVRGSHLVLPRLNKSDNAIAHFEESGRILFFIPWGSRRDLTLLGTTDVDHEGSPEQVRISDEEVRYLMGIAGDIYPHSRGMQPIASYSALRPLVRDDSGSATATSREHKIWLGEDGVVHVSGGKYTTYRVMSEEAADLALQQVAPELATVHETANHALRGNTPAAVQSLYGEHPGAEATAIVRDYGVRAPHLFARAGELGSLELAQVEEAVTQEWALRLNDLLAISTYWGYEKALQAEELADLARKMGALLGWDTTRQAEEVAAAQARFYRPANPA